MAENRYKSLDVFKGIGIIAIVFVHLIINTEGGVSSGTNVNIVMEIGCTGLMMFFIIAGFFYRADRSFLENVKKRVLQLAVLWIACTIALPFLMWCYINLVIGQHVDISEYFNTVGTLLTLGSGGLMPYDVIVSKQVTVLFVNTGYYFLEAMFFGLIIFYAIAGRSMETWSRPIILVFLLVTATFLIRQFTDTRCIFSIQLAPLVAAYALVGYMVRKCNLLDYVETQWRTSKYWIIFLVCLALAVAMAIFVPTGVEFAQTRFAPWSLHDEWYYNLRIFTFVPFTLVGCYVLLVIVSMISKTRISNIFSFVGQHTLGILILHSFIIKLISFPLFGLPENNYFPIEIKQNIFLVLGIGVATIIIAIAVSVLADEALKYIVGKVRESCKNKGSDSA